MDSDSSKKGVDDMYKTAFRIGEFLHHYCTEGWGLEDDAGRPW